MREIKFRGKELGTGKWVRGDLHIHKNKSKQRRERRKSQRSNRK